MTNEELAAIEARAEAATPGKLSVNGYDARPYRYHTWRVSDERNLAIAVNCTEEDAKFFAHARTDIPALIAEIRRLQSALNETMEFNHLRNDRDAYLLALAEWGLKGKWGVDEEFTERPQRATFGLEE